MAPTGWSTGSAHQPRHNRDRGSCGCRSSSRSERNKPVPALERAQLSAWRGTHRSTHTDTLSQSVTIPAGCHATLSFYVHIDSAETTTTTACDKLTVKAGTTTLATYSNLNKATGHVLKSFDISSLTGQTVSISFTRTEDFSLQTSYVIDDTAVTLS